MAKYCTQCGNEMHENAILCVKCGCATDNAGSLSNLGNDDKSEKSGLTTLLLCIFLGGLGIHRFYVGKTGTGIVMLLTCGGCGIWTLIDLVMIVMGSFTDAQNKFVKL